VSIPGARGITTAARVAAIPVLVFVALAVWAVSSPVGSTPDEDWHLSSIWCGQGIEQGVCEPSSVPGQRKVPEALPNAAACFAAHPDVSAACQTEWFDPEKRALVSTDRLDVNGAYPPVFYFTMHVFVGPEIARSVMTMRLVNAALFVGLMTATFWLLPRRRRTMLVFGPAVVLVPLGVFLIPSINASGWALTSAAVLLPAVVGFFETTGRRRLGLAGIAVLAAVIGAGARADAAVYTVIAAVVATVLVARWERREWKLFALPVLICAIGALFYLTSGQSEIAGTGLHGSAVDAGTTSLLISDLLNVPSLWAGVFAYGSWGLGWLDTPMPAVVWVVNMATFGGFLFLGLRMADRRKLVALVTVVLAAWLIPTVILVQSRTVVAGLVQPRYVLPLLITLAQVALFRVTGRPRLVTRAELVVAAVALGGTDLVSLYTNFRRYLTGLGAGTLDVAARPTWWWPFPAPPVAMWAVGGIALAVALVLGALAVSRADDRADDRANNRTDEEAAAAEPDREIGAVGPRRTAPASDPAPAPAAA
jgi:hypothetical protein